MGQDKNRFSNEMEIDIKEFCWHLIEQWKAIVLVALCIMALFIACMHMRYTSSIKREQQTQEKSQSLTAQNIIETLPENEQEFVASAYQLLLEKEHLSDYINTSPIMKIDPNHSMRMRTSWAIDGMSTDVNSLAMSYVMELQDESCRNALLNASGVELKQEQFNDLLYFTFPDEVGQNVICLDIFLTEDMKADAIQEELGRTIQNTHEKLQDQFGDHSILNYKSEVAVVADQRVSEKRIDVYESFTDLCAQIQNLDNYFSDGQKEVFKQLKNLGGTTPDSSQVLTTAKAVSLRNILLGLVLGVFGYAGVYLLYILLSGRVISAGTVEESSVRTLGEWYTPSKGLRNALTQDRLIWTCHHRKHLDKDSEINRIADASRNICKYRTINTLLFLLTNKRSKEQDAFLHDLMDKVKSLGINVTLFETERGSAVLGDSALLEADGVVLTVFDGKTHYKDLEAVFDLCNEYGKPIVGSVYLG